MRKRLSGNGMGRLLGAALLMSLAWTAGAGGVQAEGLSTAYSEVEPNNSFDAATKLTLGTTCAGDVSYENDVDYYSFVLDKPAEVNIRVVTHDNYAGSDSVRLYMEDAKGNKRLIASEGAIGFTGFSSMTLPGGTYYLYLDCYGGELGEYGVEVSILNSSNIEEEWNDTPEQANAKKVGEEYSGDIIGYELDDTDWFSFEIKEKSYIWQEITGFSSFLDNEGLCATLYDENLKELSVLREEDAAFGYATGEQIVVEPGKYYIRVTAQPDYTQVTVLLSTRTPMLKLKNQVTETIPEAEREPETAEIPEAEREPEATEIPEAGREPEATEIPEAGRTPVQR